MQTKQAYLWLFLAAGALGASCAGSGGSGGETATVRGTIAEKTAGRAATDPVTVLAVDDTGEAVAVTQTTGAFAVSVPTGRDYVLILSDSRGVIGAMLHGAPGDERPEFAVPEGTQSVEAGALVMDRSTRLVRAAPGAPLPTTYGSRGTDTDGDGIPDRLDGDDDNDGVPDTLDWSSSGRDRSLDHDNDGIDDAADDDIDNDGVANEDDARPRDFDNDGEDDDRDVDDDEGDLDHPRNPTPVVGDADSGRAVFLTSGCASCHGPDGYGGAAAPESVRGATLRELTEVLAHGEDDADGTMPPYPALVASAADLAAFLDDAAAPPPPSPGPDPTSPPAPVPGIGGQAVYDGNCRGCHRLGALDTLGSAPDLSGAGAMVRARFTPGVASHKGITLSATSLSALASFVDAN